MNPLDSLALAALTLYQRHLSPRRGIAALTGLYGGPSCSALARQAITRDGLWSALEHDPQPVVGLPSGGATVECRSGSRRKRKETRLRGRARLFTDACPDACPDACDGELPAGCLHPTWRLTRSRRRLVVAQAMHQAQGVLDMAGRFQQPVFRLRGQGGRSQYRGDVHQKRKGFHLGLAGVGE